MKKSENIDPFMPSSPDSGNRGQQNVTLAEVLLAWFLGEFGAHKFYRKKIGMGILYLLTMGLFGIGWLGDAISLTVQFFYQTEWGSKKQKVGSYVAAVLCLLILASCGGNGSSEASATEPQETVYATEAIAETTSAPTEAPTTEPTTVETTQPPTTEPETEATTEPEPTTQATTEATEPEPTTQPTTKATEPEEEMVWIPTKGGSKYHRWSGCSNMDNPAEVTISQAKARGFTPCKRCY